MKDSDPIPVPQRKYPREKHRVDKIMQSSKDLDGFWRVLLCITVLAFFCRICNGGELSESRSFFDFIQAVDPRNILESDRNGVPPHPCSRYWKGVQCSLGAMTITEIRLENLNLSGIVDTNSLCQLPKLRVLSLAKNRIQGSLSDSISGCTSLKYLNLSSNLLSGSVPVVLTKMKNLKRLDISNNRFTGNIGLSKQESKHPDRYAFQARRATEVAFRLDASAPIGSSNTTDGNGQMSTPEIWKWIPLVLGIAFLVLFSYYANMKATRLAKEKEILTDLAYSPAKSPPAKPVEEVKPLEESGSELVFFIEEEEQFKLEDLLEAAADLQSQGLCSSLYKVTLKNSAIFAVKRLKKLQVSFEEFGQTMRTIGMLKHQNILPLVAYNSTNEEKLVIYKYQRNGSLLSLFENYIDGKRDFPWRLRLSIAIGIARGLDYIYQRSNELGLLPHGNIKLSNIMLNEHEEPMISEYGYSKFMDPTRACLFNSNGYTAPEKSLTEQGDVFSFGVILLELLTGKIGEKSGLDLPKWVKSIVREEWTGEVFDKEVAKYGLSAFSLLNISLKCVVLYPQHRPGIEEVLEKIEYIVHNQDDFSPSSAASVESTPLFLPVVPEAWDTPGSNQG